MYVCLSQHFRLWNPNRWLDRNGWTFVRYAGTAKIRWCQFQTNRLHVSRVTCGRVNPCKKVVAKRAGQTNGQIWLKLSGSIATMDGLNLFGMQQWRSPYTCKKHVNSDFISPVSTAGFDLNWITSVSESGLHAVVSMTDRRLNRILWGILDGIEAYNSMCIPDLSPIVAP